MKNPLNDTKITVYLKDGTLFTDEVIYADLQACFEDCSVGYIGMEFNIVEKNSIVRIAKNS